MRRRNGLGERRSGGGGAGCRERLRGLKGGGGGLAGRGGESKERGWDRKAQFELGGAVGRRG